MLNKEARVTFPSSEYHTNINVSPGMPIPAIVVSKSSYPTIELFTWGLIPSFTKTDEKRDHFKMFNCRAETAKSKPAFSRLVNSQRCVVILDGYFEWKDEEQLKQPYYVHRSDQSPICIAGLYDSCDDLTTVSFLTADSTSSDLIGLHSRQPVFLSGDLINAWLMCHDKSLPVGELIHAAVHALSTSPAGAFEVYPVDRKVNSVTYQGGEACIKPIAARKASSRIETFYKRQKVDTSSSSSSGPATDSVDIRCPVCNCTLDGKRTDSINEHVNHCLDFKHEGSAINIHEVIKIDDVRHKMDDKSPIATIETKSTKKQRTLLSFYGQAAPDDYR